MIRVRRDLRHLLGALRDQGARPTCLSIAASDLHAASLLPLQNQLSCEYLFFNAKQRDNLPLTCGTSVPAIKTSLLDDGQPLEHEWPYNPALDVSTDPWFPPASISTVFKSGLADIDATFDAIWDSVEQGKLCVFTCTISNAFFLPRDGRIDAIEELRPIRHGLIASGIGAESPNRFILVRNTWGPRWGEQGYAWVSERYLVPRLEHVLTIST